MEEGCVVLRSFNELISILQEPVDFDALRYANPFRKAGFYTKPNCILLVKVASALFLLMIGQILAEIQVAKKLQITLIRKCSFMLLDSTRYAVLGSFFGIIIK